MIKSLIVIFIGGGIGSCLRFMFSIWMNADSIKWIPTLAVNILGCLILGILLALNEKSQLQDNLYLMLAVGFCGGLTTFSTFSSELFFLVKQTEYVSAAVYFLLSCFVGLIAVAAGFMCTKYSLSGIN